ncbi:MAG: hypothetical protein HY866_22140 [Chloroflexi bacterium]|nr:hypothetical protein [Chloroflexota bacterium]
MVSVLPTVNVVVEGITDAAVARRLLGYVGLPCGTVYIKDGKANVLKAVTNYNQSARLFPWFIIVDLDQKPDCAPDLITTHLPAPNPGMRLRVAVHATESWLLADARNLATYLQVPIKKFPGNPDLVKNPKITLVNLARISKQKDIREDMVLPEGRPGTVGPGYSSRVIEFVSLSEAGWRPEVAIQYSDSLRRCVDALRTLKDWKPVE